MLLLVLAISVMINHLPSMNLKKLRVLGSEQRCK